MLRRGEISYAANPGDPRAFDVETEVMRIREFLSELKGEGPIHFKPNPGNAGDSLIACATYQLFDELNLEHVTVRDAHSLDPRGKTIVYGGGGNLVEYYRGAARNAIERWHPFARRLVILPSTISGHEDLLRSLGKNVDVICRESVSFDYVCSKTSSARCQRRPDLHAIWPV
jgi:exopolysaccharide biosynthesis predicted pyruvyltransferase EpsI